MNSDPFPVGKWDFEVRRRFVYTYDDAKNDMWRSHASQILSDERYIVRDDCDGLASTVLDLMARDGWPMDKLYRAMVSSVGASPPGTIDHMIGLAKDIAGAIWVVGDTFGVPYRLSSRKFGHKVVVTSKLSEGVYWKAGAPE